MKKGGLLQGTVGSLDTHKASTTNNTMHAHIAAHADQLHPVTMLLSATTPEELDQAMHVIVHKIQTHPTTYHPPWHTLVSVHRPMAIQLIQTYANVDLFPLYSWSALCKNPHSDALLLEEYTRTPCRLDYLALAQNSSETALTLVRTWLEEREKDKERMQTKRKREEIKEIDTDVSKEWCEWVPDPPLEPTPKAKAKEPRFPFMGNSTCTKAKPSRWETRHKKGNLGSLGPSSFSSSSSFSASASSAFSSVPSTSSPPPPPPSSPPFPPCTKKTQVQKQKPNPEPNPRETTEGSSVCSAKDNPFKGGSLRGTVGSLKGYDDGQETNRELWLHLARNASDQAIGILHTFLSLDQWCPALWEALCANPHSAQAHRLVCIEWHHRPTSPHLHWIALCTNTHPSIQQLIQAELARCTQLGLMDRVRELWYWHSATFAFANKT